MLLMGCLMKKSERKHRPIEVFWKVHSPEEQVRIAAEFKEFVQRDISESEAVLYIIRIGLCGPDVPDRFAPKLNREVQEVISEHAMVKNMRVKLKRLRARARERNDALEEAYISQLMDHLVLEKPDVTWLRPPEGD
jgi:hypothetical protein